MFLYRAPLARFVPEDTMTMTATHTPGPWTVSRHPARDPEILTANPTPWKPAFFVGTVTRDADANLIAAAPEMLKALKAIVAEIGPSFGLDNAPGTCNVVSRIARAAITEAECM